MKERKFSKEDLFGAIIGVFCGILLGIFTPNPFKTSEQKIDSSKISIEIEPTNVITKNNRNITFTGTIPFKEDRFEEIGSIHTSDESALTIETYYADKFTEVVYYTNMMCVTKGNIVTSLAFPIFNIDGTPVTKSQFLCNTYRKE